MSSIQEYFKDKTALITGASSGKYQEQYFEKYLMNCVYDKPQQ